MTLPKIIGVSGTFGSGKDSLSQFLVDQYNYTHVSTSDLVREEAMRQQGSTERPVLFEVANSCRQEYGAGYFVELALAKPKPIVISGIRSLGEMKAIKAAGGVMVFVDAPIETRYQRMTARARDGEHQLSLEAFEQRESKELHGGKGEADQNLRAIGEQSDIILINDSSLASFIDSALAKLSA